MNILNYFRVRPDCLLKGRVDGARQYCIVDLKYHKKVGMFAAANQVLGHLSLFYHGPRHHIAGLSIDFKKNGLYYQREYGSNWWNYYFEPISVGTEEAACVSPSTKKITFAASRRRRLLSLTEAAALVAKHIRVKNPILKQVDSFWNQHCNNVFTIGVHYRGTDKHNEAPSVSYKSVVTEIFQTSEGIPDFQIFVATDEAAFLKHVQQSFPGKVIAANATRSTNTNPVHLSKNSGYTLGLEALSDCLLLSKCNFLIRTSSNLSLWSTYFNPQLPTKLLNRRFTNTKEPE